MEDTILNNLHRLEAIIECGDDLVAVISKEGLYSYVGPSVRHVLGVEPETFIGRSVFEFIHPDDISRIHNQFDRILSATKPMFVEPFRFSDLKNGWRWVETYATNKVDDPVIHGIIANSRDLTGKIELEHERLDMLDALKASNERYELVLQATRDVIWDMNLKANGKRILQAVKNIPGFDDNRLDEDSWPENIHPGDKAKVLASIQEAITKPEVTVWHSEYRWLSTEGSVFFISDQGYIIRNTKHKAVRMVGAMHNITDLKERELKILEQNELLRNIANINSHEIRRPAANILGLVALLDRNPSGFTANEKTIEYLDKAAKELDEVIRRIILTATET